MDFGDLHLDTGAYHRFLVTLTMVDSFRGNRILDVGCGEDAILERYFKNREVIGLDISTVALRKAKKLTPYAEFILSDARFLPVTGESVDIITMIGVLGGMSAKTETLAFREANRVLRNSGILFLLVTSDNPIYNLMAPETIFLGWRHFKTESLRRSLWENGFNIVQILLTGGVLSAIVDYIINIHVYNMWRKLWSLGNSIHKLEKLRDLLLLFQPILRKITKNEFRNFKGKMAAIARFIYITARKI